MMEINEFFRSVNAEMDAVLDALIPSAETAPTRLHEAIRWSVFAGGKRIRPALLFAVGQVFGASIDELKATAAAFEMIHTYSLIHDDLPAMDDDDMRRGKATVHKQFGDATAILAGDVLQTMAFRSIASDSSLTAEKRIAVINLLTEAAGTPAGMVSGQQLDLEAEGLELDLPEIEKIHRQKTGALISAAAVAGAVIGNANKHEIASVRVYSEKLGLLFQITDDLLDVTQLSATLGKTAGKDERAEKATYPKHFGIEKTLEMASNIRDEACQSLASLSKDCDLLVAISDNILARTR